MSFGKTMYKVVLYEKTTSYKLVVDKKLDDGKVQTHIECEYAWNVKDWLAPFVPSTHLHCIGIIEDAFENKEARLVDFLSCRRINIDDLFERIDMYLVAPAWGGAGVEESWYENHLNLLRDMLSSFDEYFD